MRSGSGPLTPLVDPIKSPEMLRKHNWAKGEDSGGMQMFGRADRRSSTDNAAEPSPVRPSLLLADTKMSSAFERSKIQEVTLEFLRANLARLMPELFTEHPRVDILIGDGVTANFFEVVDRHGAKYFIKARSLDDAEIATGSPVSSCTKAEKEAWISEKCSDAGARVPQIFKPVIVPSIDLPDALDGLRTGAVHGRDRPFILNVQRFVDGVEGFRDIYNHQVQVMVCRNLGAELGKINRIASEGFGGQFDSVTKTFRQTWIERFNEMELHLKSARLNTVGLLSQEEEEMFVMLTAPLASWNPQSSLLHTDLHTPNYKYRADGSISAVLDLESAEGGPWQRDYGEALARIEALPFRITRAERIERAAAFTKGYGRSAEELQASRGIIDGFRAGEWLNRLHIFYCKCGEPYVKQAYLEYENVKDPSTRRSDQLDRPYRALGCEAMLKALLLDRW